MAARAELARLARAGTRLRPVFIVGEARSGTTLLFRLLQQQPGFGPSPPQLAESEFMVRLLGGAKVDSGDFWKLRNFLMDDPQAWERFKAVAAPLLKVRSAAWRVLPRVYSHRRVGPLLGAKQLTRAYLAFAAEVRGVTRLIEKTPSAAPYCGRLLAWFPDARLIYIHRHPVDVLTSYWRRAQIDRRHAGWAQLSVPEFAARYEERSTPAREWARRRPDAVRLLRYEDLVADPSATIESLCAFLEAPYDPAAIAAPGVERESPDPLQWKEVSARSKRWEDYMSSDEAAELERLLAPVMDALGHQRYSADSAAPPEPS